METTFHIGDRGSEEVAVKLSSRYHSSSTTRRFPKHRFKKKTLLQFKFNLRILQLFEIIIIGSIYFFFNFILQSPQV